MSDPKRVFTATGVIGASGSGKTSLAATFAEYLWEQHQRVLLLYSSDGGAIPTMVQRRMQQGLIRFWRMRTRSAPGLGLETMTLASKGYWPRSIDPLTGETLPDVHMVPPITQQYTLRCRAGHTLAVVTLSALVKPTMCKECKRIIPTEELVVEQLVRRTKGFEAVGGTFHDGLSSQCTWVLDEMDGLRGGGHIGGEKAAFGGAVVSGSIKMGGNNRADIGFAQSRAHQFVMNSLSIPYLVEGPVWTGLTLETNDEYQQAVVGFKLAGVAATDAASGWFGNVAELTETKDETGQPHVTLILRAYTDDRGRRHLLKTSGSPWGIPDMLIDPPRSANRPFEQASLGVLFRLLDADLKQQMSVDTATPIEVPGSYGEEAIVGTPETPTPATPVQAAPAAPVARPSVGQPVGRPAIPRPATPQPSASPVAGNGQSPAAPTAAGPRAVPAPPGRRPPARAPGA